MDFFGKAKIFIAGAISATLITTTITAYTSTMRKNITVDYSNIKINIDGEQIEPKDGNGNSVEPFIYDGTTYLPVRAVSESLGKYVDWDGDSKTVYISSVPTKINRNEKELNMWVMYNSAWPDADLLEVAKPYLAANPDVGLNLTVIDWGSAWTKLTAAAVSGEGPDITQIGTTWVGAISYMDVLTDFSGRIKEDDFLPQTLSTARMEGSTQMTAVPWFVETRALFYRKDACEKAGVDPAKDFETWDSFKAALKKLNNVVIDGKKLSSLGMPGKNDWNVVHNFAPWVYGAGGSFLNSDYSKSTLSSQETYEGIKFYSELATEGLMDMSALEKNTSDVEMEFANGEYATSIIGPWNISTLEDNKKKFEVNPAEGSDLIDKVGVAMLPAGPKERCGFLGGSNLSVFKSSKYQAEAIGFVKYLTGTKAQIDYCKKTGNLPTVKAAYEDPWITENSMRKVFKQQMSYTKAYPSLPEWGPIETYIQQGLSKVWDNVTEYNGNYSEERTMKVLKETDETINILLSQPYGDADIGIDYDDSVEIDNDNLR
ncbi:extracellular solute-binding protein [Acetivibrio cellulolyticus]|uniref:extracellular solute-binding protein n=1 Tax=Acetivibrio cellulolyticus TaxID=35830 RepID=UPI0001E2C756|nr:extracellular solute-binding protein [Acetivibrio cellulolyticus]